MKFSCSERKSLVYHRARAPPRTPSHFRSIHKNRCSHRGPAGASRLSASDLLFITRTLAAVVALTPKICRVCHSETHVRPAAVINGVVPRRFTATLPAVKTASAVRPGSAASSPGGCADLSKQTRWQSQKRRGLGGLFTLHLFVLPPTFIQTLLFDGEVYAATGDWS